MDAWRGLWNPAPPSVRSSKIVGRALIYLVTPLALALLFGELGNWRQLGEGYVSAFIVGTAMGVCFELLYRFAWPAVIHAKPAWPVRVAAHALTIAIAVGVGGAVAAWLGAQLYHWDDQRAHLWLQGAVISSVIITLLVVTDELRARARELERRGAEMRLAVMVAELGALQARTDPHFLFNSLNTVAALIPDDPQLAESLLVRLSAVFRYALDAGRRPSVALAEELDAVGAYLDIEALRLGDRLRWSLDRAAGVDAIRIPPLVVQPLVDNAIRHGAGGRSTTTTVTVSVTRRGRDVVLVVEDRGESSSGAGSPASGGSGTALADLRSRLALAYGERAHLATTATPTGWRAELVLPAEAA